MTTVIRKYTQMKRVMSAGIILCCLCYVIVIRTDLLPGFFKDGDLQRRYNSDSFQPSARSIFFHETTSKGCLVSRQACAVEAAARAHPDWEVHVLFSAPLKTQGPMKTLQQFKNVFFTPIQLEEYTRGTPLESFVARRELDKSQFKIAHSSDVLRYATLYKWGGVYLDLDVITVKSLSTLNSNWAVKESDEYVSSGALSFSRDSLGRTVANKTIREIATNFRGDIWGHNGPGVITRILKQICSVENVLELSADKCREFEVYDPDLINPIPWQRAEFYFMPGDLNNYTSSFAFHVWNQLTHDMPVTSDSRYADLARKYCPSVYKNHTESFGGSNTKRIKNTLKTKEQMKEQTNHTLKKINKKIKHL